MPIKTGGLFFLSLFLSLNAIAQKNEAGITVGAMFTEDQQSTLVGVACPVGVPNCGGPFLAKVSTSVAFEGFYARSLYSFGAASLGVEFPVVGVPGRDVKVSLLGAPVAGGSGSVSSLFFTPALRIKFLPSGPVSPFFSFGGGLAHFSSTGSVNRGTLQFGGGADFKTPLPHLAIRGEIRDFWGAGLAESGGISRVSPRWPHNVFAGAGIVFKF
jgi:hypothetical protein